MHNASETELIELLKDTIEYLKKENESLKEEKAGFLAQIQELQQTTVNLNETVEYLKRKLFGRSREKQEDPGKGKENSPAMVFMGISRYRKSFAAWQKKIRNAPCAAQRWNTSANVLSGRNCRSYRQR